MSIFIQAFKSRRFIWTGHVARMEEGRSAFKIFNRYTYRNADDVNLIIGDDIRTIERNSEVLANACKDIGFTVNTGKTKYMETGRH